MAQYFRKILGHLFFVAYTEVFISKPNVIKKLY